MTIIKLTRQQAAEIQEWLYFAEVWQDELPYPLNHLAVKIEQSLLVNRENDADDDVIDLTEVTE